MPKNNYAVTINPSGYKNDDRVTFKKPYSYGAANVADGPTMTVTSGIRFNYPSGTAGYIA